MGDPRAYLPSLISLVGVDGSGKTTLGKWLVDQLAAEGRQPVLVWSRFRNYLSKPLLAVTRLTGHNHYKNIDGVRFGFHDFERLIGYRELYAALQAIDVNIAAYLRIQRQRAHSDILVCERGPWDTLVDVTTDTRLEWLPRSWLGRAYTLMVRRDTRVLWIDRDRCNILRARPELVHDDKLPQRIKVYALLAAQHGWDVIDNNSTLETAEEQIRSALGLERLGINVDRGSEVRQ